MNIVEYNTYDYNSWQDITLTNENYDESGNLKYLINDETHTMEVISAIASIARNVKIYFYDAQYSASDVFGYSWHGTSHHPSIWQQLIDDKSKFDVVVTSIRASAPDQDQEELISELALTEYIIAAAGYSDPEDKIAFPAANLRIKAVGSIDHEGSSSGDRSDFSDYLPQISSGHTDENGIAWSLPGNGVPLLSTTSSTEVWKYGQGNSYSAPYLAGIVAVIIDGYIDGRISKGLTATKPSGSTIYNALRMASSRSVWNNELGWGYININSAYGNGYYFGYNSGGGRIFF